MQWVPTGAMCQSIGAVPIIRHATARCASVGRMTDMSLAARYESLIRLAGGVRSHHDGRELFELLARELRRVVPFDAIAQYDDGPNKVNWHICANMAPPSDGPSP